MTMPDLNILFDIDSKIGLERINKNSNREVNRLDLEKLDFHYKVREGYNILANKYNKDFIKINAEERIEEVFEKVRIIIEKSL